jgi:2-oxoglutarate dehydrogenase E2 component (dihydrolipoamide succinyltransferase)
MGESIFEGTITKWLKNVGDAVQKDEPLFEISTDKVDAEIPSPVAGVLTEVKVPEGATVEINTVVAVVTESGSGAETTAAASTAPQESRQPTGSATSPTKSSSPAKPPAGPSEAEAAPMSGGTDVIMPQMGESIFEGTITKWLKKAGEMVQKDEALFEISTDKVDAEIPAPVAGILTEIKVPEGSTVEINTVVAVIGGQPAASQPDGTPTAAAPLPDSTATEARAAAPPSPAALEPPAPPAALGPAISTEPIRSSPLVRRMARENGLDLRQIAGSGTGARITKDDVLRHMRERSAGNARPNAAAVPPSGAASVESSAPQAPSAQSSRTLALPQLVPMSRMRSIIAQRMVESKQTAPHAYTIYKVDMTRVVRIRQREKAGFEHRNGVKLTYMPFIAAAAVEALSKFPIVNASLESGSIRYHQNVHLGIAVALEWGLIVPVIRQAEDRSFLCLARAIADLADRARTKHLKPDEASGSTFTLTNSGIFGGEYGTPIINQPESAILAIGGLRKEPAVLTDAEGNDTLAIRSMQQFCLGFDHRLIDGADAGKFMSDFKKTLETWDQEIG